MSELLGETFEHVEISPARPEELLALNETHDGNAPTRIVQRSHAASPNLTPHIAAKTRPETETNNPATHLLADHQAIALTADTIRAHFDEDGLLRPGTEVLINGASPTIKMCLTQKGYGRWPFFSVL